jgi:uncharacterized protein YdeI (BOF family)
VVERDLYSDEDGPSVGIVMGKAKGTTGGNTPRELFSDPQVRRELTKLQLLDHLCGQGDRHKGNYFIHRDGNGRVTVSGIDNDQCFGKNLHHPNDIAKGSKDHNSGFHGTRMPMIIDTDMAQAFRDLTPERLDELLAGKLTKDEIKAAKDRLAGIKVHIDALEYNGMIITPDQWGERFVGKELTRHTSYVGRDSTFSLF